MFEGIPSPFTATRYHSLVVEEPLPEGLTRTGWTDRSATGEAHELMAFRHDALPLVGVQFHPESYLTPAGPTLLGNFLAMARTGGALHR